MNIVRGSRPKGRGRPRKWKNTSEGDIVGKRISDKVEKRRGGKYSNVAMLSKIRAAESVIGENPEYGDLTAKSLVNRAGEAKNGRKATPGVPLSAPLKQHWLAYRRRSPPEK